MRGNIPGGMGEFMRTLLEECISSLEHCRRNASVYENIAGGMHLFIRTLQEERISL